MKIVIIRHGKPDISTCEPVTPKEFGAWIEAYDNAGIAAESKPSESAIQEAHSCNVIICSNLLRAIESANILNPSKPALQDGVLKEMELPYGNWDFLRLTPNLWAIIFRILWLFGYSKNCESFKAAKQRAKVAAQKLVALVNGHGSVLFVGHGFLNRYIARELLALGWTGPKTPGRQFWDFGVYCKEITCLEKRR